MQFLGLWGFYAFLIQGTPKVSDPKQRLGGSIGTPQQWSVKFWMGAFDVDALTGFVKGALVVPFAPAHRHT